MEIKNYSSKEQKKLCDNGWRMIFIKYNEDMAYKIEEYTNKGYEVKPAFSGTRIRGIHSDYLFVRKEYV